MRTNLLRKMAFITMLMVIKAISYSQNNTTCDDFTTYNWQPNGDTLGHTQGGTYPILGNSGWILGNQGMYGVNDTAEFSFDGSSQVITYEIYAFYNQYNQMGFSVNGSSYTALNGSFPVTIGGVTVNLDTSAANNNNWENAYLSFTGNVNSINIYTFESGIKKMCVSPASIGGCDDFTTYNWQPNGDTLGYTQGGTYPILGNSGWMLGNQGMYGVNDTADFSFNGSSQVITYEIYGFYNQYNQMGFSVNGSSFTALNGSFPVTIGGVTVNLDTTAANTNNWENSYLSFTGNVNSIDIYTFESGIKKMCVDSVNINAVPEFNNLYSINIYPNPASSNITIEHKNNIQQKITLSLLDIQGQQIVNEKINFTSKQTIDISSLSNGVYILMLQNEKINYVNRIVIQNR